MPGDLVGSDIERAHDNCSISASQHPRVEGSTSLLAVALYTILIECSKARRKGRRYWAAKNSRFGGSCDWRSGCHLGRLALQTEARRQLGNAEVGSRPGVRESAARQSLAVKCRGERYNARLHRHHRCYKLPLNHPDESPIGSNRSDVADDRFLNAFFSRGYAPTNLALGRQQKALTLAFAAMRAPEVQQIY